MAQIRTTLFDSDRHELISGNTEVCNQVVKALTSSTNTMKVIAAELIPQSFLDELHVREHTNIDHKTYTSSVKAVNLIIYGWNGKNPAQKAASLRERPAMPPGIKNAHNSTLLAPTKLILCMQGFFDTPKIFECPRCLKSNRIMSCC